MRQSGGPKRAFPSLISGNPCCEINVQPLRPKPLRYRLRLRFPGGPPGQDNNGASVHREPLVRAYVGQGFALEELPQGGAFEAQLSDGLGVRTLVFPR
ncbi:hypothetical protein TTMY_1561 [Thermus thermophilus]|nr:hypothetical protein TTMY_1561 [Thermus thermophilus]BDB12526.1 hypothetical protein TthTMY_22650 [Thermus thermophilus]